MLHTDLRQRLAIRVPEGYRHDRGQAGQRQNIHRIVMKDGDQLLRFPRTQVLKVNVRNQLAW